MTKRLAQYLAPILAAAGLSLAHADQVKQDNENALDLGTSWMSGTAPGPADIAIWSGAYALPGSLTNATFSLNTPVSWGGISVGAITGAGAGPVCVGGIGTAIAGSQITIGSSGISLSGANQDLISNATTNIISGDQTWNLGTRNLRFGATGLGAANANLDGSGTVTISGNGVADMNQGTGSGSGLSGFSGKFIVNPGATLRGLRSGTEAWGTSIAADALALKGGTLAVGGISGAQGNYTWSAPMTLSAGTTSLIDNQIPVTTTKGRTLTLNGLITGSGNVVFNNSTTTADPGFGFIVGATNNTYTGTTTLTAPSGGELRSALGSVAGPKTPFGTGDVIVSPGTTNRNQAGGGTYTMTIPNNIKLNGAGATLTADDAYQTYTGNITLTGTNILNTRWSDKRAYFTGVVQDGASTGTLIRVGGSAYFDNINTYTGGTTINGGNMFVRSTQGLGPGFVELPTSSGALYFTPLTAGITSTISAIRTRRDVVLGNNVLVNISSGNFGLNSVAGFWVKANGTSDTGKLTSSSGTLNLSSVDGTGAVTTGNLTTSDHQIQVVLADYGTTPLSVVKNGANSLQFTQPNTFTGGLTINGGRVNANNAGALGAGAVSVNNGAQAYLNSSGATYSNNITLNGIGVTETAGTLGALRFGSVGQTYAGTITAATDTRIHAQNGDASVSGALAGSANIEKTGASQITFSGTSPSFTGTLTAAQGPLSFSGGMAGNLAVADGATILGEGTVAGRVTIGTSTGAVIRVQGNTPAALTAAGGLTLNGISTISIDSVPAAPGAFPVINYGGTLVGGVPNLTVAGLSAFRSPPVLTDTGTAITLALQNGLSLTWAGTNGTAWDLNTTVNWSDGTAGQTFMQMDSVKFDDSATNGIADITGLVQPSSVTFDNSLVEYVINGTNGNGIVGPGSIVKNGTTNVTLGGVNDFTGSITVNAGTLKMGSATAFGRTAGITVAPGGQVDLNGQTPGNSASGGYTYTIAGTGPDDTGAIVNDGAGLTTAGGVKSIVLTADASIGGKSGRFDIGNANLAGYGTITGNGHTLTKVGTPNMAFRGDASVSPINIVANEGGIWAENTDSAFGATNGTLTINNGARAGTYGTRTIATPVTINNGGTLHNQGGGVGTWTGAITANEGAIIETGTDVRIAGTLNAPGSIDKTGANQLIVVGTASITGDIDIQDGVLQVGDMGTNGSIGNPGSVTLSRNSNGVPALRYRLGGVDASLSSPVNFGGEFSELRHHPAYPTNKLTLTGTVGTSDSTGVLDAETGTIALGGSATATLNTVRLKGNPSATERAVLELPAGASLIARFLDIGGGDRQSGIINQTGNVTMASGGVGIRIGHWGNNSPVYASEYNLNGGTLDATALGSNSAGTEGEKVINVGWDGYALFSVGGGTAVATAKVPGVRYARNNANPTYPCTMTVNANGLIEVGDQGIVGRGTTKTVVNGGSLRATASSTWTAPMELAAAVGNVIDVLDTVIVTNTGSISGIGALTKSGPGALVLTTTNSYSGATAINAGGLVTLTGGSCANSVVTLAGTTTHALYVRSAAGQWSCAGLSYGAGTVDAEFNFGVIPPSASVAPLQVNGNLSFSGTVNIHVSGNVSTVGTYPLIKYTGTLSGTPPTVPTSLPVGLQAEIVNNVANKSIDLKVTMGNVLTWAVGNGIWDIDGAANWKNSTNAIVTYQDGRAVQLDDSATGASPIAITVDTTVNPGMVTAANASKEYTISGSGSIAGFAGLTKKGVAKLTLSGTHTYSSGTLVSEGTLQLGDGTAVNGSVSGPIANDGTLIFANPIDQANSISITGTGKVGKAGSGVLTFSTRQAYTGGTVVNGGILDLTAGGGATGTIRGVATVNAGGTLRLSTSDAIGYSLTDRVGTINLVGGTMDVNVGANSGVTAWNQTLGGATINMTGGTISGLTDGNIDFYQGTSTLNTFTSSVPSVITGVPISPLRQGSTTFTVEDGSAEIDLDISSVIRTSPSGDAAGSVLIKAGAGTMRLSAYNSIAQPFQVNAGTLLVEGSLGTGADVIVKPGGILGGNGSIAANVTVESGGTLSPGTNGIGTMTLNGELTLNSGSTTVINVNASTPGSDLVQGLASATYGGHLVVSNLAGTLADGQSFTVFAASAAAGNFASIAPAPGPGLSWRFDPASGALSIAQGPPTTPTTITSVVNGSNLEISWPADYIGWQLQSQVNPRNVGLANNWTTWPGSTTTNRVFVPITAANPTLFLRLVYPPQP